jgi:hypothetical protein
MEPFLRPHGDVLKVYVFVSSAYEVVEVIVRDRNARAASLGWGPEGWGGVFRNAWELRERRKRRGAPGGLGGAGRGAHCCPQMCRRRCRQRRALPPCTVVTAALAADRRRCVRCPVDRALAGPPSPGSRSSSRSRSPVRSRTRHARRKFSQRRPRSRWLPRRRSSSRGSGAQRHGRPGRMTRKGTDPVERSQGEAAAEAVRVAAAAGRGSRASCSRGSTTGSKRSRSTERASSRSRTRSRRGVPRPQGSRATPPRLPTCARRPKC